MVFFLSNLVRGGHGFLNLFKGSLWIKSLGNSALSKQSYYMFRPVFHKVSHSLQLCIEII